MSIFASPSEPAKVDIASLAMPRCPRMTAEEKERLAAWLPRAADHKKAKWTLPIAGPPCQARLVSMSGSVTHGTARLVDTVTVRSVKRKEGGAVFWCWVYPDGQIADWDERVLCVDYLSRGHEVKV